MLLRFLQLLRTRECEIQSKSNGFYWTITLQRCVKQRMWNFEVIEQRQPLTFRAIICVRVFSSSVTFTVLCLLNPEMFLLFKRRH